MICSRNLAISSAPPCLVWASTPPPATSPAEPWLLTIWRTRCVRTCNALLCQQTILSKLHIPTSKADCHLCRHPRPFSLLLLPLQVGIWTKQNSFYFQSESFGNVIEGNIAYNGPRAGVNFDGASASVRECDVIAMRPQKRSSPVLSSKMACFVINLFHTSVSADGMGGGSQLIRNVLFNFCRESSDHGACIELQLQIIPFSKLIIYSFKLIVTCACTHLYYTHFCSP